MALSSSEFRIAFQEADHLLPIVRADGSRALAVGLNGDNVVLHGGAEVPLAHLTETGIGVFELATHAAPPINPPD